MNRFNIIGLGIVLAASSSCSSGPKAYPDAIESVVESHQDQFDRCQEYVAKHQSSDEGEPIGEVEVAFTAAPAGQVTNVQITRNTTKSLKLEECIKETFRRLKFEKNEEGRLLQGSYTLKFKGHS